MEPIELAILMTLNNLKGHLPIASLFRWHFLYSYAAVDKILTDHA